MRGHGHGHHAFAPKCTTPAESERNPNLLVDERCRRRPLFPPQVLNLCCQHGDSEISDEGAASLGEALQQEHCRLRSLNLSGAPPRPPTPRLPPAVATQAARSKVLFPQL